jgi:outer membrane murein-binding lipoprotein Lpp
VTQLSVIAIFAMAVGGLIGAAASESIRLYNAAFLAPAPNQPARTLLALKIAVLGLAAAAAVPLLLQIAAIGSTGTLVDRVFGTCSVPAAADCQGNPSHVVLIVSFCVIAGFAAPRLFESLAGHLLRKVEETAQRVENTEAQARALAQENKRLTQQLAATQTQIAEASERVEEVEEEVEEVALRSPQSDDTLLVQTQVSGYEARRRVLEALKSARTRRPRAVWSIAASAQIEQEEAEKVLKQLVAEGLLDTVGFVNDPSYIRYRPRENPRELPAA